MTFPGGNLKPIKKRPPYRENFKRDPRTGLPLPYPRKSQAKKDKDLTIIPATSDSEVDVVFQSLWEAAKANHTEHSESAIATLPDEIERGIVDDAFDLETPVVDPTILTTRNSTLDSDSDSDNSISDADPPTLSSNLHPQAAEAASRVLPASEYEYSDGHCLKKAESQHWPAPKPTVEDIEDEDFQAPTAHMYSPDKFVGTHSFADVPFIKESAPTPEPPPNLGLRRSTRQRVAPKRFAEE